MAECSPKIQNLSHRARQAGHRPCRDSKESQRPARRWLPGRSFVERISVGDMRPPVHFRDAAGYRPMLSRFMNLCQIAAKSLVRTSAWPEALLWRELFGCFLTRRIHPPGFVPGSSYIHRGCRAGCRALARPYHRGHWRGSHDGFAR